jgi:mRNA interferase HicA
VKKRELMKRLRAIAKAADADLGFVREGGNHEIWTLAGERLVIPRHSDINELTARGILDKAKEVTDHDA